MLSWGFFIDKSDYLRRHLISNNHYGKEDTIKGRWLGTSCENFGVKAGKEVNEDEFKLLLDNKNPATGAQLMMRKNASTQRENLQVAAVRSFYDFTVFAPKSFSILAGPGDVNVIRQWHRDSVDAALKEMEKFSARQNQAVKTSEKLEHTKNFCAAVFGHDANAAKEPQLHEHVVVFNLTHSADGDNYTLESKEFFSRCGYLTAVYRNELARHAIEAGIEIEFDERKTPQIEGMSGFIEHFSGRTKSIQKFVDMCENITGLELSKTEKISLSSSLRVIAGKKSAHIKPLTEIQEISLNALSSKIRNAEVKTVNYENEKDSNIAAMEYAIQHVFEKKCIAPETQILQIALAESCGRVDSLEKFKEDFRYTCADLGIVSLGTMLAPAGYIEAENEIIHCITQGKNKHVNKINNHTDSDKLSLEQKKTFEAITNSHDKFTALTGEAETGKTLLLSEVVNTHVKSGIPVFIFAPSDDARNFLKAYGEKLRIEASQPDTAAPFENAQSLQSLFRRRNAAAEISSGSLVILEEAYSVSLMQFYKFSHLASRCDWKVLFTGTPSRHKSDETGNAFSMILSYSGIKQLHT